MWWIRQRIEKAIKEKGNNIRIPISVIDTYNKIQKIKQNLGDEESECIDEFEIARQLGLSEQRTKDIINSVRRIHLSLNETTKTSEKVEIVETIASPEKNIEDAIIDKEDYELIENIIKEKLKPREAFVLYCKFGVINEINKYPNNKTLEQVGDILGLTRERIRQILNRTYMKIMREYNFRTSNNNSTKQKTYYNR